MSEAMPPMPPDVQRLLEAERGAGEIPDDARARLRHRLEMSVGVLAFGAGIGAASAVGQGATAAVARTAVGKSLWVAAAAFVLGGAAGAGVHAMAVPAPKPAPAVTVVVERRVEVPVPAAPPSDLPLPPPVATSAITPPTLPPASAMTLPIAPSAPKKSDLDAERSILEIARTALGRGEPASAMVQLDLHAQRFPYGQLVEEREALYVQALARAGRMPEARARAARFEKRFPNSLLLPVVTAATE
jgi:hypothetical protein